MYLLKLPKSFSLGRASSVAFEGQQTVQLYSKSDEKLLKSLPEGASRADNVDFPLSSWGI